MRRFVLGTVVGGLVYFGWGMVSWMVLPFHGRTFQTIPEEKLVSDVLKTVMAGPGLYLFPSPAARADESPVTREGRLESNPAGIIVYAEQGKPMSAANFVVGLLSDFAIAFIVFGLLRMAKGCATNVLSCAAIAASVGVVGWLANALPYWNWMYFPTDVTLLALLDGILGFGLMGAAQSFFVDRSGTEER